MKRAHQFFSKGNFLLGITAVLLLIQVLLWVRPAQTAAPNTDVCGPITSNATWTLAGSPYIITCDVQVNNGVTLTVQSGVVVRFNLTTSLLVNGTLVADSCTFTTNDPTPARDDWGHILFGVTSVDATFDANGNYLSGSKIQGCLVEWGGGGASVLGAIETGTASPFISQNTIRNNGDSGIYASGRSANQPIHITGNHVSTNQAQQTGNGINVTFGQLISNTVTGNFDGGAGVYAVNSTLVGNQITSNEGGLHSIDSTVTNNTISDNTGRGIFAEGGTLTGNVVSGNSQSGSFTQRGGGIYISGGTVSGNIVSGNSVYANLQSTLGGGIYATSSTVISNTVEGNTATADDDTFGGGIFAEGGNVVGNIVRGNTVSSGSRLGGGIYANGATAENNTVENNSAGNGGGLYGVSANLINNTVNDNQAAQNGGGIYVGDNATASENIITNNNAASGGGVYSDGGTVSGNTLSGNGANSGAGIYAIDSSILGNTLSQNTAQSNGGGLYLNGGIAEYNTATENDVPSFGHGSGAYITGTVSFRFNQIVTNTVSGNSAGGLAINGQLASLELNNLFGNEPYDAEVLATGDVTGTNNFWGPSVCTAIPGQIYDGDDIPGRGELRYAPSLYSPVALAQMQAPANLTLAEDETSVSLSWTAVPNLPAVGCRPPDLATPELGYRLYYGTDSTCVFDGTGLSLGSSPVDIGTDTTITLADLSGTYYFAITAYDYLDRESPFSNQVNIGVVDSGERIYLPIIVIGS